MKTSRIKDKLLKLKEDALMFAASQFPLVGGLVLGAKGDTDYEGLAFGSLLLQIPTTIVLSLIFKDTVVPYIMLSRLILSPAIACSGIKLGDLSNKLVDNIKNRRTVETIKKVAEGSSNQKKVIKEISHCDKKIDTIDEERKIVRDRIQYDHDNISRLNQLNNEICDLYRIRAALTNSDSAKDYIEETIRVRK